MKTQGMSSAIVTGLLAAWLSAAFPLHARLRPAVAPWPETHLRVLRFDATNGFDTARLGAVSNVNARLEEGWSGYALRMAGTEPALLRLSCVGADGRTNLVPHHGSVRFWFRPYWGSADLKGAGPGADACLIQIADGAQQNGNGWKLAASADGNSLSFRVRSGGQVATVLSAPVLWRKGSGIWWRWFILRLWRRYISMENWRRSRSRLPDCTIWWAVLMRSPLAVM